MRTTFSGIEIARRALQAQQRSLDIVGHNVANANTPGYARQKAIHTASQPYPSPQLGNNPHNGQMGTGVQISQVTRMRDEFVEMRLRQENHNHGYWQSMQDGLEQVELIFNEPSENNIHHALDMYWDSMQQVSKHPDNESVRAVVLQRAEVLVETVRHARSQLGRLRDNMNSVVSIKVNEINSLADRVAQLNDQIGKVTSSGNNPNDLLDKRDELLQRLSEITNIEVVEDQTRMVMVSVGGTTLVQRNQVSPLSVKLSNEDVNPKYDRVEVIWPGIEIPANITGGELGGILHFRDEEMQGFIQDLNQWTADVFNTVNAMHRKGYTLNDQQGEDFFAIAGGQNGQLIGPNDDASQSIRLRVPSARDIAASSHQLDGKTVVGNGEIALEIAGLRYNAIAEGGTTLADSFNSIISRLGVKAQESRVMLDNGGILVNHLQGLRESVSGVSLDEEMADMIRFQHAYTAAARIMTMMDETLDVIINRLGTMGR